MTTDPIVQAQALVADGRTQEAVVVLTAAGSRGSGEAFMQLAVWQLGGQVLPRTVRGAHESLRQAVAIGHVDAALMEIALTANGGGEAKPDWTRALALLTAAAPTDPVAADHLRLVEQLRLDEDGHPLNSFTKIVLNDSPDIVHLPGLLSAVECAHLARVGQTVLGPSQIIDPVTGRYVEHPIRTSSSGAIGPAREDMVVRAINLRLAAVSGTSVAQGEALTILHYAPQQQFRLHHDAIAGASNQRVKTILIYMNDAYHGGETVFPKLGIRFRGKPGDALMFDNCDENGRSWEAAQHAGAPVIAGAKWLATRWIRAAPVNPWIAE